MPPRWAQAAADILDPPAPVAQEIVFAELGYSPTPQQWLFHRATEYDVLYGGAAGGGKTKAVVMHSIWAARAYPGIRIAAFRRTFDELHESLIPELARVGFAERFGAKWNGTKYELTFANGSLIRFRYLENLIDASRRQGGEYQLLLFEEATLLPPGAADVVKERLRTTVSSSVPVLGIRATANPGNASHAEVKARYIDTTAHGATVHVDAHGHTVRFIPARVSDNPYVDPGYRSRLEAIPDPARRAAMLDGSWDSFSGQVFTEWRHDRHVVTPWTLPESWPRYVAVDWGYTAPWCVLWGAEDEDGRMWVYRELYARGVGEHEQARQILSCEEVDPPVASRVGDPAMMAKRGDAESISAAYAAEGCYIAPAENDRLGGWARVHQYLAESPACNHHRALGWETCPRLHVFSGAANLIRTLPTLPYSQTRVEDVDTHAEDHAADALRYLCMQVGRRADIYVPSEDVVRELERNPVERYGDFGPYAHPDQLHW